MLLQFNFDRMFMISKYSINVNFKVALFVCLALVQAQDFDYASAPRPAPSRVQPGYSGPSSAPRPAPVAIIKQIDR